MNGTKQYFAQKSVWAGLLAVVAIVALLGWAFVGSTVNPVPKRIPVALVAADKGADVPGKGRMNIGDVLKQKLTTEMTPTGEKSPFEWTVLDDEQAAAEGLDRQTFYAVVVLPETLSADFVALLSPQPKPAEVRVLVNQGKSGVAATMVTQAVGKMLEGANAALREQALGQLQQMKGDAVSIAQAKALAAPLAVTFQTVHPILPNTANGNAPVVLTQLAWISALAATVLLFVAAGKAGAGASGGWGIAASQLIAGLAYAVVASAAILAVVGGLFGLDVPDVTETGLFLTLAVYSFFLLQSAIVNWIGLKGMPVLVLLFFFGLPILNLPPEFLPDAARDWLYSWIPFRFSAEGLRDLFYFRQGLNVGGPASVLGWIAAAGAVVLLASGAKRTKRAPEPSASVDAVR
ncbi:YhgE/Pip domain-containing protein [Paenibacillus flagellatus]|nr:ABC transporter permease [Paenibacillus flagellatus]